MGLRRMTADEADDHWTEHGDTSDGYRPRLGPPSRDACIASAERMARINATLAPALAQIERAFGRKTT